MRMMKRLYAAASILCFLLIDPSMALQFNYVNSALWGDIECVKVEGNYAYCAYNPGLMILDISDPISITEVSHLYLPGMNSWIDIENDLAFTSNYDYGLYIVDISDPLHPCLVSQYSPTKKASRLQADDDYTYLRTSDSVSTTYEFIDISNPGQPVCRGSYTPYGEIYSNMYVVDNLAYVGASHSGFIILDISNPASPDTLSIIHTEYAYGFVYVKNDYAYVTASTPNGPPYGACFAINIADPRNPYQTFSERAYDPFGNLDISNGILYVQYSEDGRLTIWNLADPSRPSYLGFYEPFDFANYGFCVNGDKAYVPRIYNCLEVVDMQNPANPNLLGMYDLPYAPLDFIGFDDYLICNTLLDGSFIFDISDTPDLEMVSNIDGSFKKNLLVDHYLYSFGTWRDLSVFDLADPSAPVIIDSLNMSGCGGCANFDDAVYVQGLFGTDDRFYILDSSDPAHPIMEDSVLTSYARLNSTYLHDHYLFFTLIDPLNQGFIIYDISNPFNPSFICHYRTDYQIGGMAFKNNYVYATVNESSENIYRLLIIDISNLNDPRLITSIEMPEYTRRLYVFDDLLFIGRSRQDIIIYDISEETEPVPTDTIYTGAYNYMRQVGVSDDLIYLALNNCLLILRYSPSGIEEISRLPLAHTILSNYPNPFNASTTISYSLPQQSQVTLDIYDILGRKVQSFQEGRQSAGEHSIILLDKDMPSGIYLYKLTAGEYSQTRKMTLLK